MLPLHFRYHRDRVLTARRAHEMRDEDEDLDCASERFGVGKRLQNHAHTGCDPGGEPEFLPGFDGVVSLGCR